MGIKEFKSIPFKFGGDAENFVAHKLTINNKWKAVLSREVIL